ncbi:2Fe-2S iron-sulfur cluster-binding protein [Novosphingobium aquimarinum]|uniref:2Fe-2S iron-sulfur cluster-binding protein n=1 Tax=Novosphingobium aquimarinum TaxID=2682494 RepID=UPI0012EC9A3B|nr:2Fe-2S iron-sulfur cluster-binding protein [Novosphingobium aquimarinum]
MVPLRIELNDGGDPVCCREGENLLAAVRASRNPDRIISGCRGGGCGICKVQVRHGNYRCGSMSRAHVSVEEQSDGFALACQLWPLSDMSVSVAGRLVRCSQPK